MRIVLDTNILARSILNPTGPAFSIISMASDPPHRLIMSTNILAEMLRYDRLRAVHGRSDEDIDRAVARIDQRSSVLVQITEEPPPVVQVDRDDDYVIATAIAGNADVICTLDRHFQQPAVQE